MIIWDSKTPEMCKRLAILICIFTLGTMVSEAVAGRENLLREGFILRGVDGRLIGSDSNDVWFFELNSDVNDYENTVKAVTRLELLPSSGLEKMTADVKMRSEPIYRLLDGKITKYKGRNFIFPKYFLPLSKTKESESQVAPESKEKNKSSEPSTAVNEPNDILSVPPEVVEKLKASRKVIANSKEAAIERTRYTDTILLDRTGFLVKEDGDQPVFVLDALGRNLQHVSLRLLPCEVLELIEHKQSRTPSQIRFKIAGIRTEYKNQSYLLLHKATQVYNYGNFGR
jgi:hypothetical protein